jgi:hypothetical protein
LKPKYRTRDGKHEAFIVYDDYRSVTGNGKTYSIVVIKMKDNDKVLFLPKHEIMNHIEQV